MRYFRGVVGLIVMALFTLTPIVAQDFAHPAILHKASDFARMRQKVAEKAEPWYSAWNNLLSASEAQLGWNPRATETVIRGGTGDNVSILYRDVAAAYEHALIYNISGDVKHGDKAIQILNAWSLVHKYVSGNADRYLASGLFGYQFANAAELMRDYPGFELERFKQYMLDVFYYPMNERFVTGNAFGASHNDAVSTNYRVNWDICNMNAMLAISILCDNRENFEKTINYAKSGDGNGNIHRAVNFVHSDIWGQWEESGRDQGHAMGGVMLYGLFCEMAWNQNVDMYGYDDSRYRKGAEYVARYNIWDGNAEAWKYEDLPYSTYTFQQGPLYSPRWTTEAGLSAAVRGKYGSCWEMIYNHYGRRLKQTDKVQSIHEIAQLQPSIYVPNVAAHADTYDTPGVGTLTFREDTGASILPWLNMDVDLISIDKRPKYGTAQITVVDTDSVFTINGSGNGIGSGQDGFHFVYQRIINDGEIVARITELQEGTSESQAGIMIRENLSQTAKNVFLNLTPEKGVSFTARTDTGAATTEVAQEASNTLPYYLKLTRTEDTISAYISSDTIAWTMVGKTVVEMSSSVYIGLAATSGDDDKTTTALFDKVKVTQGNMKPFVTLFEPKAEAISYIAPANVLVKGSIYDKDGSITKAELLVNGEVYTTLTDLKVAYYIQGLEEGDYEISLRAYDNSGAMKESDAVAVSVGTKTTLLPYYSFDKVAASYALDVSGNLRHAKISGGATYADGQVGNGIVLDGVDDYGTMLQCPFEALSEFSFVSWVYLNSQDKWSRIFDVGAGTGAYMFLSPFGGDGKLRFEVVTTDGRVQNVDGSMALPTKKWYHVAVTLKDNVLKIYMNGIALGTEAAFMLRPYDMGKTTQNYIGKSQWSADPLLNGSLDELRFFNYGLSQDEVKEIMNGTFTAVDEVPSDKMTVYPTVSSSQFNVVFSKVPGIIEVYNITGSSVFTSVAASMYEPITLHKNGVYFIKLTEGDVSKLFKVVKLD